MCSASWLGEVYLAISLHRVASLVQNGFSLLDTLKYWTCFCMNCKDLNKMFMSVWEECIKCVVRSFKALKYYIFGEKNTVSQSLYVYSASIELILTQTYEHLMDNPWPLLMRNSEPLKSTLKSGGDTVRHWLRPPTQFLKNKAFAGQSEVRVYWANPYVYLPANQRHGCNEFDMQIMVVWTPCRKTH